MKVNLSLPQIYAALSRFNNIKAPAEARDENKLKLNADKQPNAFPSKEQERSFHNKLS